MSLGKNTKCDLSAGVAKIDLEVLTKQTENHFFSLIRKLEKRTNEVLNGSLNKKDRENTLSAMSAVGSDVMMSLTKQIAETTELLHTLYESTNRSIEIVR